jgi:hypothetical protein
MVDARSLSCAGLQVVDLLQPLLFGNWISEAGHLVLLNRNAGGGVFTNKTIV